MVWPWKLQSSHLDSSNIFQKVLSHSPVSWGGGDGRRCWTWMDLGISISGLRWWLWGCKDVKVKSQEGWSCVPGRRTRGWWVIFEVHQWWQRGRKGKIQKARKGDEIGTVEPVTFITEPNRIARCNIYGTVEPWNRLTNEPKTVESNRFIMSIALNKYKLQYKITDKIPRVYKCVQLGSNREQSDKDQDQPAVLFRCPNCAVRCSSIFSSASEYVCSILIHYIIYCSKWWKIMKNRFVHTTCIPFNIYSISTYRFLQAYPRPHGWTPHSSPWSTGPPAEVGSPQSDWMFLDNFQPLWIQLHLLRKRLGILGYDLGG